MLNQDDINPADLGLLLAQLMETDPDHLLVVAARLALEDGGRRQDSSLYADDYVGGRYHRPYVFVGHSAAQQRRYPPFGDRAAWVKPKPGDYRGQPRDLRRTA